MMRSLSPRLLAGVLLAGVLATGGCSSDSGTAATSPSTAPARTTEPAGTDAPTTDAPTSEPPVTDGPTTTESDACREIVHQLGTACVPAHPQRIVVLDTLLVLPTLVDAGAPVVGSLSVYDVGDPFPEFVDSEKAAGIETVGSLQTVNVEKIAALEPDLIIGASIVMEPIIDQLEAIAPSVATNYAFYVPTWRDDARLVGEAAGVADAVKASIDALDARIADVKAKVLAAHPDGPTLTRVDVFTGQLLYYEFACTAFGDVLLAVGVRQPPAQVADCSPNDYQSVLEYPSLEQVDILDADVIVAYQQQAGSADVGASPLPALEASPLWATLPAVVAGNVHVVGDAWGLGASVPAFQLLLDDVEGFLS